jgi:hypothetical protein
LFASCSGWPELEARVGQRAPGRLLITSTRRGFGPRLEGAGVSGTSMKFSPDHYISRGERRLRSLRRRSFRSLFHRLLKLKSSKPFSSCCTS